MVTSRKWHQIRIPDGGVDTEQVACWTPEEVDAAVKRFLDDGCSVFISREWTAIRNIYIVEGFPST